MKKLKNIIIALVVIICGAFMFTGCDNSNENSVYSITVNQNLHGTISVDKETAEEGEIITISTDVDEGYSLYALLCDGVIITSSTITMPAKDITISAIFEQIDQDFVLHKGSYVQIADASTNGTYVQNNTFFNTVTIKENNLFDLFVKMGSQFYEFENVTYSQNDDTITANVGGMDYSIKVINNETLMIDDGNYMQIFYYQEDQTISNGSYNHAYVNTYFVAEFNDNDVKIVMFENDEISFKEEATYDIKGNNLFIELDDRYIFAKLRDVDSDSFNLLNMCFGIKSNATITQFGEEFLGFGKFTTSLTYGKYFARAMYYPSITNYSYYYQFNAIDIDENTITIAGYDFENNNYLYLENLSYEIIGQYIVVVDEDKNYVFKINPPNIDDVKVIALQFGGNGYIDYYYNEHNIQDLEFENGYYYSSDSATQYVHLEIENSYAKVKVYNDPEELIIEGVYHIIGNILIVQNDTTTYVCKVGENSGCFDNEGFEYCLVANSFNKGFVLNSYYEHSGLDYHGQPYTQSLQITGNTLNLKYRAFYETTVDGIIEEFCEETLTFVRTGDRLTITSPLANSSHFRQVGIRIINDTTVTVVVSGNVEGTPTILGGCDFTIVNN